MSESSRPARREYTRAEILDHIRRLADGDTPPTSTEFYDDDAAPALTTVKYRFGSWNEAVEAAGFEPRPFLTEEWRWSDAEILRHIQRLGDGDTPPTQEQFADDEAAPSPGTARNHFGSWNGAVEAAGFEPRTPSDCGGVHGYDRDELVNWLVAYRCEFGLWPSGEVFDEWPGPREATFRRAFGSIPEAREAAAEVLDQ